MTKYDTNRSKMKRAIVILSCVSALLIAVMLAVFFSLYDRPALSADRIEGVWYCEALSLTIDADSGTTSHIMQNNASVPILHGDLKKGSVLKIYIAEEMPLPNSKTVYRYGEQLFRFQYQDINDNLYSVLDENGKKYTFVRIS